MLHFNQNWSKLQCLMVLSLYSSVEFFSLFKIKLCHCYIVFFTSVKPALVLSSEVERLKTLVLCTFVTVQLLLKIFNSLRY